MIVAGIQHTARTTCRAEKVRCDGSQPCYRNCLRRGIDCSYMNQGAALKRWINETLIYPPTADDLTGALAAGDPVNRPVNRTEVPAGLGCI
ncbi:hypothetical protein PG994_003042 [Apiospora phragmitis]|uniref:Zn(2)-C6 fungal-type domain-containing protein n=1 Tax=Apiospora phragmitis TaxID=2905665 RepID=A0ABR1W9T6_9PEZI